MIGEVLSNRYKIIAELGSGGMAWVYLAEDLREKQHVAVKVLYPQHSHDLSFLQRFMQEAKLAMSLSQCAPQRQIVCVLDYGSDQDIHYLVMEFVQGRDLGQILEERGSLPWQEALSIARQVALALAHANYYEIVHRDIKPGNIMILPDGAVRVLDFGIARAKTSPELTLAGFVGSPNYAAPEQAMGETVDTRADIYSLGIVMYRMFSGSLPFEGKTPWAVVNQHISTPPPPLEKSCPDLPDSVIHLVQKALAKRPKDRFQTPEEMVKAIEAVLLDHDLSLQTSPVGPSASPDDLDELYRHAQKAVEIGAWQRAVDLFSQILKIDPDYRDVAQQLSQAGEQIRLATLYRAARRALQLEQWEHALEQIQKIEGLDPEYKDVPELRAKAEKQEKLQGGKGDESTEFPTQVGVQAPVLTPAPEAAESAADHAAAPPEANRRGWLLWALAAVLVVVVAVGAYFLYQGQSAPIALASATAAPSSTATASIPPAETASPTARPATTNTRPAQTATRPPSTPSPIPTAPTSALTPSLTVTPTFTTTPTLTPTQEPQLAGQIAFPRFDSARGAYDVYLCRVDGGDCRRLLTEASQPSLLPDGTQIVVHSWKPDDKGLILHSLSGQRIWQISDRIEAARPSVDFQGKLYTYHSREEADRQPRLYRTHDAETRPIRREGNPILGVSPSWLPDGRILYSGCLRDTCGIIVMHADGASARQVTAGGNEANPEASPDGQQVAFMSQRDGNWEVYVVHIDGSGLRRLTRNTANDGLPTWSPGGRHLAFVSDRDGRWAVWVMAVPSGTGPDSSEPRKLFDLDGPLDGQVRGASPHETHGWVEERISWSRLP